MRDPAFSRRIEWGPDNNKFKLVCFSDVHWGAEACDEKSLKNMVETHKDEPNTFFINIGDNLDCITTGDKRYRRTSLHKRYDGRDDIINRCIEDYCLSLLPIRDRLLGIASGNHEETIIRNANFDVSKAIAKELHVEQLGYAFFYHLYFSRNGGSGRLIKIYGHHGYSGGARTEGGTLTSNARDSQYIDADIILMAHAHDKFTKPIIHIGTTATGKIIEQKRMLANTGTFLKTFSKTIDPTYSEKKFYPPREIGYVQIDIELKTQVKGNKGYELKGIS